MKYSLLIAAADRSESLLLEQVFSSLAAFTVIGCAHSGAETLALLQKQNASVLLTDCFLPDMDGISLFEQIDVLNLTPPPTIFAMSAINDDRLLRLLNDKILYCFTKPVDPALVSLRVTELLRAAELTAPQAPTALDILNRCISEYLLMVGVPVHLKGYYYLRDAIRLYALSSAPVELNITTHIYPAVAITYQTRPMLVEHAMRNAIEIAWTRGNLDAIIELFGYTVNDHKGKPSNSEFVAMIAERVRMKLTVPNESKSKTFFHMR